MATKGDVYAFNGTTFVRIPLLQAFEEQVSKQFPISLAFPFGSDVVNTTLSTLFTGERLLVYNPKATGGLKPRFIALVKTSVSADAGEILLRNLTDGANVTASKITIPINSQAAFQSFVSAEFDITPNKAYSLAITKTAGLGNITLQAAQIVLY